MEVKTKYFYNTTYYEYSVLANQSKTNDKTILYAVLLSFSLPIFIISVSIIIMNLDEIRRGTLEPHDMLKNIGLAISTAVISYYSYKKSEDIHKTNFSKDDITYLFNKKSLLAHILCRPIIKVYPKLRFIAFVFFPAAYFNSTYFPDFTGLWFIILVGWAIIIERFLYKEESEL